MDSVLLSTAYFPPIIYFSQLVHASEIVIEKEENFPKQTYRNRCIILGANGPLNLSVPVRHVQPKIKTSDICISNSDNWQPIHYRAIESAYRKSPFFEYYIDDLKKFFIEKPGSLLEFNTRILKTCLELINCRINVHFNKEFEKEEKDFDFRYKITPKKDLTEYCFPEYYQVFAVKFGFIQNLSILDLIFNTGPESKDYLRSIYKRNGQI
jgi:hypothetical protein